MREAALLNPGPWVEHSATAARAAETIAARCPGMDAEAAYALGLLHDIGRREGYKHIAHIIDGYRYLTALGYDGAAAVCLTHSFPLKEAGTYFGGIDCSPEGYAFIQAFLDGREYGDYDRLIQLCDAISLPDGVVLMEKRLVDVVMRHGLPEWTLRKWGAYFGLKRYFDALAGGNIYALFGDIEKNTFN